MTASRRPCCCKANLKQLRLPTMLAECEKLAREAAAANEAYESYLLRLTEVEVATRSANALAARIRAAGFPVVKDFDTFDFTAAAVAAQAEGAGAGPRRVDRAALQLLPDRQRRDRENARGHGPWAWPRAGRASGCGSSPRRAW